MKQWGMRVYLDGGRHVGVDAKPHYYCGLLNLYWLAHMPRVGLADSKDVPAAEAARIFRRLAVAIHEVSAHLPILAACPDPAVPERGAGDLRGMFGERLREMAGWHFAARPENGRVWISRERPDPARWEWALTLPGRTFRRRT